MRRGVGVRREGGLRDVGEGWGEAARTGFLSGGRANGSKSTPAEGFFSLSYSNRVRILLAPALRRPRNKNPARHAIVLGDEGGVGCGHNEPCYCRCSVLTAASRCLCSLLLPFVGCRDCAGFFLFLFFLGGGLYRCRGRFWTFSHGPYDIVATLPDAGVIGAIPDTLSLDSLKKVRRER